MIRALRENWALFVGMLLLMTANGLLVTLLSVRGGALGFSATEIGLMQACYPLGALAGAVIAPRLVARVGHVRAFAAFASLCSVASIVHLMTGDAVSWGAMRFLAGFCFPGLYVIAESWLNARAANRSRAAVLSAYFVIQTLGASVGQALAGMPDRGGTVLFGLTSILVSLSLLPLMISRAPAPAYVAPERMSLGRLARISPMAVAGAALNGAAQGAFYVGLPLFGLMRGMSAREAVLLLVAGTLSGAAAQFPAGWLSDRTDRRLVVGGLALAATAVSGGLALGAAGGALLPAVMLLGAATLPVYALCVAHANDQLSPAQMVPASGALVLALNAGILVGAFAGPFALGRAGPEGWAWLFAGLSASTLAVAALRRARSTAPTGTGTARPIAVLGAQSSGEVPPPHP